MSCPLFPRNLHFPALRSGHRLFQRPSPPKQIPSNHLARQFRLGLVGAALVCGLSSAALAQSRWNGNVDGDWDTATNWDAPPFNGSDLIFDGFYNKTNTNNLLAEIGLLTLTGSDWNITAGTLALNAGITASGTSTVNGTFTLGAAQTFQNSTGTLTVSGTVANGGNLLTVGGLGDTLLSAAVGGTGGLTKSGSGTLTLSANTTYTGNTSVNEGTLKLGGLSASPAFAIASGAVLELVPTENYTTSTTFTGSGTLRKSGSVSARWDSAAATFALDSGSLIDVQEGTFVGGSHGNEIWTNNKSDLHVAAGAIFNGVEANVRVDALTGAGTIRSGFDGAGYESFTFGVDNGSGTFDGVLENNIAIVGSYTKAGTGTQILTGNNTYTGTTTISGGTLQIGNGGTSGSLASASVVNNATLAFNRSDNSTFGGALSGSGHVTKLGAGTLAITGDATHSGGTTISAGTLQVGNGGTTGSISGDVTNNATLAIDRSDLLNFDGDITGTGHLSKLGAGNLTLVGNASHAGGTTIHSGILQIGANGTTGSISGNILNNAALHFFRSDAVTYNGDVSGTGSLTKLGSGTLTLGGDATHSWGTTISAGTLQIGNGGTSGSLSGNVTNNAAMVFNRSDNLTFGGAISGSGDLTKLGAGTLAITGDATHSGGTTVSAGTLQIGNGGTTGSISGDVTNNAALHFFRSDDLTYNGNIDGTGSLTKLGSGTLTLGGYHTFTGDTTVSEGTLRLTNAIYDRGAIAGTLSVQSGATLDLQAQEIFGDFSVHFLDIIASVVIEAGGLVTNGNFYNPLINLTLNGGELRASGGHSAQWAAYQLVGTVSVGGTSASSITTTGVPNSQIHIGNGYWGGWTIFDVADVTGDSAADLTISAELQDSPIDWWEVGMPSGLHKAGDGTLLLTGNNTYTDYTYIYGGILQIGNGGTSGSVAGSFIFLDSGTALHFNRSDDFTYNGYIDGEGSLTKLGAGTLTLGGILALIGPITLSEGTLRLTGSTFNWSSSPSSLFVQSGTTLDLQAQDIFDFDPYYSYVGVVIEAGGLVTNGNFYNPLTDLTLNGGELRASGGHSADLPAYRLKGTVSVGGTSTSSITTTGAPNSQIQLGDNTVGGFTTFDVADATGDSAADLTISAELQNGRDAWEISVDSGLNKTGDGTLELSGDNTFTGAVSVTDGVLRLNASSGSAAGAVASVSVGSGATLLITQSNQVNDDAGVTLSGGTVTRGAGVSESFGDLNLTAASFIDFGSGATGTLTFGTYTPTSLLTVGNFAAGNVLRFGSDLTGSINDAGLFSFDNEFASSWNGSTFTITAIPEPSTVLAAIGLAGLMLWPARKRLLGRR